MYAVVSSCCAKKDDSIPIPKGSRVVEPSYYLEQPLVHGLLKTRERILRDPLACVGARTTYAFDLNVRFGRAYKDLFANHYDRVKSLLLSGGVVEWFFLSGGYGIVHALEEVKRYQATFNRTIAYKNRVLYTADLWKNILPSICDSILSRIRSDWVYVFGSRDYTRFIKETSFWKTANNVKMFESTGSAGPTWLSPILNELVRSILQNNIDAFNSKYDKFTKQ
jgi:hypothetical protein